jgi:septal ring factor EnvC (AmiA/AmiB activator)
VVDDSNNLVLEHLRVIRTDLGEVRDDVREVKQRLTSLEVSVATVHGDFAGQSGQIDRVESGLKRIEHRLDLRNA